MATGTRFPSEMRRRTQVPALRRWAMGPGGLLSACAVALLVALPISAAAATKTVQVGLPPSAQKKFDRVRSDVDAYFPSTVTVRIGDVVRFVPSRPRALGSPSGLSRSRRPNPNVGIHTVDLPAKGRKPLRLVVPSGKANATDAAGSRFWFRGFESTTLNPTLRVRAREETLRYDGSRRLTSGLPTADAANPMTVRFTRAGTYRYYCNIHPGMSGTVRVLPKGRRVPSRAADRKAVSAQVRAALRRATALVRKRLAPGVVSVGKSSAGGVQRYVFSPAALTVPRGTTIRFVVPVGSRETHTATTGPGNPRTEENSYLGKLARSIVSPDADPVATYPSDPPTLGAVSLTPRLHGNGFWNSGVLDAFGPSTPPAENRVKFRTAGKYTFYCLIHPFMKTTITVR